MDLQLHFVMVGNIVEQAALKTFIISSHLVQISISCHLHDHVPPSVRCSLGVVADVTLLGLGRGFIFPP